MNGEEKKLITEQDTIHAIVTRHPVLKDVLRGLSPRFEKLGNPLIFNTAARVATVKDAAKTGKLYLREMLYELNEAIGLGDLYLEQEKAKVAWIRDSMEASGSGGPVMSKEKPEWVARLDGGELLDVRADAEDPFGKVSAKADEKQPGEGFILVQKFYPAPLIRYLSGKGFLSWVHQSGDTEYRIYFMKTTPADGGNG